MPGSHGMQFGVVLQNDPPAARVVELARQAETFGFSHVWTFDSHLLWEEPYVVYSQILANTRKVTVGPMVTNPATRDWTVTASLFATLNEMFGNRTVCGIGRGDSAVRVINGAPVTLATLRESIGVIRGLANGEAVDYKGTTLQLAVVRRLAAADLGRRVRAQGPRPDRPDRRRVHPATRRPRDHRLVHRRRAQGRRRRRTRPRHDHHLRRRTRLRHRRHRRRAGARPRPVPLVRRHGRQPRRRHRQALRHRVPGGQGAAIPQALSDYIAGRQGYDYNAHGKAGNTHTDFVPDEVIDRFCLIGPVAHQIERLQELRSLGVDQFALYLQHDAKNETLTAYGEKVIPAVNTRRAARL